MGVVRCGALLSPTPPSEWADDSQLYSTNSHSHSCHRKLESDLDEAVVSCSVSPSPSLPVTGSPESPKPVPSDAAGGSTGTGPVWEGSLERFGESEECECGGENYVVGDVVYVKPRCVFYQQNFP